MSELLELGAAEGALEDRRNNFEGLLFRLRISPFSFLSINTHLVPSKLSTSFHFA